MNYKTLLKIKNSRQVSIGEPDDEDDDEDGGDFGC